MEFKLHAPFQATGDQPEAIAALARGVELGLDEQVLLGVTGSGKTFTMASVIEKVQRPTLVLAHNKTLAAQLCAEFKEFFPENAVEYFVSYYDYYQPEAYIPHTDTYIAKDASTNEEIDRLRLSATCALLERRDVIVVSSVSCIYGLGEPDDFAKLMISLRPGQTMERDELLRRLVEDRYERNDVAFERNRFRVRGDAVDIYPAYWRDRAVRVEFFGDEIDAIREFQPVTGVVTKTLQHTVIYPASHYVTTKDKMERAIEEIERELEVREKFFTDNGQAVEAQRIHQRTKYDIEMMRELGYCTGIENYSRVISARPEGSAPMTLLDYFPKDFLLFVDESHVTLPQVRAMYNGDRARKDALVQYGFRLPCAYDNRPLRFEEFEQRVHQRIYVSATPGDYERERAGQIVEQVIRPTGLLDPRVEVRPVTGQIDDLVGEINARAARNERVLVTTLTKKMAEDLTEYLRTVGVRVRYMHADVETIERMELIRDLRLGEFDVLVGINLLREGLDLPEVSLVAILDADKEGFLRSETSLVQTIGRAARNADGLVILYADTVTPSMKRAMDETERRRAIQDKYNKEHGIVPQTIRKDVREILEISKKDEDGARRRGKRKLSERERDEEIRKLEKQMQEASRMLESSMPPCCATASSSCARNKNKREKAMKKYLPYLNILGAAACWGCIGLFNRFLMRAGMGAANIVVIRNFGGLVLLTLIFALRDRSVFHVKAKHLPIFFGTGVVSMVFFTLCYFKCQELCSLAVSAILLYTAPAMVVLMSAAVFRERITRKKLLALALALLGCSFVTGVWSGDASVTAAGVLFGLGAGFLYALYSIFAPFGLRHYTPFTVVYWTFVFGGLGSLFLLDAGEMRTVFADGRMILVALGLIVISTVLPYLLYTNGLAKVESGKASILASLEPVVASFVGILAFGEPVSLMVFLGLGCILACVYVLR